MSNEYPFFRVENYSDFYFYTALHTIKLVKYFGCNQPSFLKS